MKKWLIVPCFLSSILFAEESPKRVYAHLLVKDYAKALEEAKRLSLENNRENQIALIRAYAAAGFEKEAVVELQKLPRYDREIVEEVAWGVIRKGCSSSQCQIRLMSLLGAFFTQDAVGAEMMYVFMDDSNAWIRAEAVHRCCYYRDEMFQKKVLDMLSKEKSWIVKQEAIRAVGKMGMKGNGEAYLKAILKNERGTFLEKGLAIDSLLELYEDIDDKEVSFLLKSPLAGFRMFGAVLAAHFDKKERYKELLELLHDPIVSVRIEALNAIGLYFYKIGDKKELEKEIKNSFTDVDSTVSITACWVGLLLNLPEAYEEFKRILFNGRVEDQRFASAALVKAGFHGKKLLLEVLEKHSDPYVRLNVALGLVTLRVENKKCAEEIFKFYVMKKDLLMQDGSRNPLFSAIVPSTVDHKEIDPAFPESVDLSMQMELLSFLALLDDPRAQNVAMKFLKDRSFRSAELSSLFLLTEGSEGSFDVVKSLLNDPDKEIAFQAALVLAFLGKDSTVITFLEKAYKESDYKKKLHILEAVGRIGSESSFPFLLEAMKEPFVALRIVAASSLIQCVNH